MSFWPCFFLLCLKAALCGQSTLKSCLWLIDSQVTGRMTPLLLTEHRLCDLGCLPSTFLWEHKLFVSCSAAFVFYCLLLPPKHLLLPLWHLITNIQGLLSLQVLMSMYEMLAYSEARSCETVPGRQPKLYQANQGSCVNGDGAILSVLSQWILKCIFLQLKKKIITF